MFFTWIQSSTMVALCAYMRGNVHLFLCEANVATLQCDRKLIATVGGVLFRKYTQAAQAHRDEEGWQWLDNGPSGEQ